MDSEGENSLDCDYDESDIEMYANSNFEDFTFVQASDNSKENTRSLDGNLSKNSILSKVRPGTWMYIKILKSTPILASQILTKNLKVKSIDVAYLDFKKCDNVSFFNKRK